MARIAPTSKTALEVCAGLVWAWNEAPADPDRWALAKELAPKLLQACRTPGVRAGVAAPDVEALTAEATALFTTADLAELGLPEEP